MQSRTTTRLERLDDAFGRLRRLWESPVLRRRFVDAMGASVDPSVIRTLRAVRQTGADTGVTDVAGWLAVDTSTASRLVEQAVAAGYLERGTSPTDRRRCVLTVTPDGDVLLDRALAVREGLLSELTADWSDDDVARLADLTERLADVVAELEQRP